MEDRHSFSDPRPVLDGSFELPTWQVDVFRDGVVEPIMTLTINNETLPPRIRKKKVVWKLPTSVDQTPNFGFDEKQRLLDLFKQEKKAQKRQSKKGSDEATNNHNNKDHEGGGGGGDQEKTQSEEDSETKLPQWAAADAETKRTNAKRANGSSVASPPPLPPPRGESSSTTWTSGRVSACTERLEVTTPPKNKSRMMSDGGYEEIEENTVGVSGNNDGPTSSNGQLSHGDPPLRNANGRSEQTVAISSLPPPGFDAPSLQRQEVQPLQQLQQEKPEQPLARRFFVVPSSSSSNNIGGIVPVDLVAKCVVDIYYPCITHGHVDLLMQHYALSGAFAQKSLSVGGAHAVCSRPEEFRLQLQSLHQWNFLVKGVVAQQGFGDSILVLITGTVQNVSTNSLLPFCHSLSLINVENEGYQIHNDAMAFLTD